MQYAVGNNGDRDYNFKPNYLQKAKCEELIDYDGKVNSKSMTDRTCTGFLQKTLIYRKGNPDPEIIVECTTKLEFESKSKSEQEFNP